MPRNIEEMVIQQIHRSETAINAARCGGLPSGSPVVTISRRMGSGARIIADKLAKDLGWSLWDKEILDEVARDGHVSQKVVEAFDERSTSELELLIRSMLGEHEVGGFLYRRHLASVVLAIASLGNAVILGRGANYILPDALSVRIDASDELRIRNMMSYEDLSQSEAVARIRKSDRERRAFLLRTFGREKVRGIYDLTLWMDKFRPDDAVDVIKKAIEVWCMRKAGEERPKAL